MGILKLAPSFKDYLWGGTNLRDKYNKAYDGDVLAETWELSCHKDGNSYILENGVKTMTLAKYIDDNGKGILGENAKKFENFPVLIKFIDAKDNLSVQVHPNDEYAIKQGEYGKTEVWYVLDCEDEAYLYYGFNRDITKEEFKEHIENETLLEVLNKVNVKKGDVFFIEAGTIHAIGKNITIAEIQQNSNLTYRVYDYGRVGVDGKKRDLHINKAVDVTNTEKAVLKAKDNEHIAKCKYFTVDKVVLENSTQDIVVDNLSFKHFLFVEGNGVMELGCEKFECIKGDSFFVTANSGKVKLSGNAVVLVTYL